MLYEISREYLDEITRAVAVNQTPKSDEELYGLIQAALEDISRQGAEVIDPQDPSIKHAVKLYCKGNYGHDNRPDFIERYKNLSAAIALDHNYKAGDAE